MNSNQIKKILCPVDLSKNSLSAIDTATMIARENDASVTFIHVLPAGSDEDRPEFKSFKEAFLDVRPSDPCVKYDHMLAHGNPGPEIAKVAQDFDVIVMATHGNGGLIRLLVGSVAQYVLRHAKCQVVLTKSQVVPAEDLMADTEQVFVTKVMHHICPVRGHDNMLDVLAELDRAGQTAAPVVDVDGACIGILTKTDIERFQDLQARYDRQDPTVIPEMFVADKYGHIRCGNVDFPLVSRHMSTPVITIANTETIESANKMFESHPQIHHLVVVDESDHPVGILDSNLAGKVTA